MGVLCSMLQYYVESLFGPDGQVVEFQEPGNHFPWFREDLQRFKNADLTDYDYEGVSFEDRAKHAEMAVKMAFGLRP